MRLYQQIGCYLTFTAGLAGLISGCEGQDKLKDVMPDYYFASVPMISTSGMALTTGDFNEDGHLDLIVGAKVGNLSDRAKLYLFLGDGKGNFRKVNQTAEESAE